MHISSVPDSLQEMRGTIQATIQRLPRNFRKQPKAHGKWQPPFTVMFVLVPQCGNFAPNYAAVFKNLVLNLLRTKFPHSTFRTFLFSPSPRGIAIGCVPQGGAHLWLEEGRVKRTPSLDPPTQGGLTPNQAPEGVAALQCIDSALGSQTNVWGFVSGRGRGGGREIRRRNVWCSEVGGGNVLVPFSLRQWRRLAHTHTAQHSTLCSTSRSTTLHSVQYSTRSAVH